MTTQIPTQIPIHISINHLVNEITELDNISVNFGKNVKMADYVIEIINNIYKAMESAYCYEIDNPYKGFSLRESAQYYETAIKISRYIGIDTIIIKVFISALEASNHASNVCNEFPCRITNEVVVSLQNLEQNIQNANSVLNDLIHTNTYNFH